MNSSNNVTAGIIGPGLLVGSGNALSLAGPAGILISFSLVGIIVFFVMYNNLFMSYSIIYDYLPPSNTSLSPFHSTLVTYMLFQAISGRASDPDPRLRIVHRVLGTIRGRFVSLRFRMGILVPLGHCELSSQTLVPFMSSFEDT
jgi:hypothetical protein